MCLMGVLKDIQTDMELASVKMAVEYRSRLSVDALKLCGNAADAEDLVSSVFNEVFSRDGGYDPKKGELYSYLKGVLDHLYARTKRRAVNRGTVAVEPSVLAEDETLSTTCTEDEILARSDHDALRAAIGRLPPDYRDAVLLHYFSELPIVKVARILSISEGTVKWRLCMARKVLASDLGGLCERGKKPLVVLAVLLLGLGAVFAAVKTGGFGLLPDRESEPAKERTSVAPIVECVAPAGGSGSGGESTASGADILNRNETSIVTVTGETNMNTGKLAIATVMTSLSVVGSVIPEKEDFGLKGATLLEFIESTGTQWIDTGFIVTGKSGFDLDIMSLNTVCTTWNGGAASGYGCVMGAEKTGGRGFWWLGTWNHFQTGGLDYAGAQIHYPGGLSKGNRVFNALRNNIIVYDPSLGIDPVSTVTTPFTATGSLGLFADKNSDTGFKESASLRLYGLKLYEGDEVKRDYLPCLDPDGVACLYDCVAGDFVYNCGSGLFVTNGAAVCVGLVCQDAARDGELLMATVSRQTDLHCAWKVYAFYGESYHGTDKDAWTADGGMCVAGRLSVGVASAAVAATDIPETARYLRFCAVPETVDCIATAGRWSAAVDCVEAGRVEGMVMPRFASAEVVSTAFVSANVSVACAWKGKGASGYDVLAVCEHGGRVCTNRLVSGSTEVGSPVEYVLDGLLPHTDYTLHFLMVNDASDSVVRFPAEGELSFSTKPEFRTRLSDFSGTEQLEYVTFPSGAYVDTGVAIDNHQIECRFYDDGFVQDKHVFGSQADYNYTHFTVWQESGAIAWYWGVKGSQGHGGAWSAGEHTVLFNDINEHKVYVDGEALTVVGTAPSGSKTNGQTLWVGRRGSVANFTGRVYSFKITDANGNVVSDLVPCNYTGVGNKPVVGLFDVVSGVFRPCLGNLLSAGPTISAGAPIAVSNAVLTVWRSDKTLGRLNAKLVLNVERAKVNVYVMYGNVYGGDSFVNWAKVRRLSPIGGGNRMFEVKVSSFSPANRYVRFAIVPVDDDGNEDLSVMLWSDTMLTDELDRQIAKQGIAIIVR